MKTDTLRYNQHEFSLTIPLVINAGKTKKAK